MKLNNRGWGLGAMIGFLCVFALFFLVISLSASRLGIWGNMPLSEEEQIVYASSVND